MKKIFLCVACSCMVLAVAAQNVGINNTDPKAALDINGGLRLRQQSTNVIGTTVQLASNRSNHLLTGSPTGDFDITFSGTIEVGQHLIITNSTLFNGYLPQLTIPPNITAEFTYSGINWQLIGSNESVTNSAWGLFGNEAAVGAKLGHTDNRPIQFISDNMHVGRLGGNNNILLGLRSGNNLSQLANPGSYKNIAIGDDALKTASSATYNIAIGHNAMAEATGGGTGIAIGGSALNKQAPGALENIAIGYSSQAATTSGTNNISIGRQSLFGNTTGSDNIAIGWNALLNNITNNGSTAIGHYALERAGNVSSPMSTYNTALGYETMRGGATVLANTGRLNTAMGYRALANYSSADNNIAIGAYAMERITTGSYNTALGDSALTRMTTGRSNVAIGSKALSKSVGANNMVAIGDSAMGNGLGSIFSTAVGSKAMMNISGGAFNTAVGSSAMALGTSGQFNTAIGYSALEQTDGRFNTAVGSKALNINTTGIKNTAIGDESARYNTTGANNTGLGYLALLFNNTGNNNVGIVDSTLAMNISGSGNVALGHYAGALETSSNKLYIENTNADNNNALIYGDFAADSLLLNAKTINKFSLNVRGSNALEMGYGTTGKQTDAGKICYGCFGDPVHWLGIVGGGTSALGTDRVIKLWSEGGLRIKGNALPDLDNSYSLGNSSNRWNQVWAVSGIVNTSDARLKTNITASPYGLNEVMKMQPVQYNWKTNPGNDLQIGFLAQDIQKIIPEAVVEPANGDPLGMKYSELIPVLVKGMQEQQKLIENQQKQIDELHRLLKAKQ